MQKRPGAPGLVRPGRERSEDRGAGRGEGDLGIAPTHFLLLLKDNVVPLDTAVEARVGLGRRAAIEACKRDRAGEQIPPIAWVGGRHDLDVGPVAIPADEVVRPHHDPGLLAGRGRAGGNQRLRQAGTGTGS